MQNPETLPWATARPLPDSFFQRDARELACALLGKVIRRRYQGRWLSARIIETEAYLLEEKGSHASLGYTEARRALFMDGGTLYMYYARGGDSLNFSAAGPGNGVLIKSGHPLLDEVSDQTSLRLMQQLNPATNGDYRPVEKLCAGQTLLCKALALKVPDWNAQRFDTGQLFVDDDSYRPQHILQTTRLGIPVGRDENLPYRFVDATYARHCTRNPMGRNRIEGRDYQRLNAPWKAC